MKAGKTAEPSSVTTEFLQVCKNESVKKLAELVDNLLPRKGIPKS